MPCVICNTGNDTCIDHVVPVAKGGGSTEENLQPLCQVCNVIKDINLSTDDVRKIVRERPEWFRQRQVRRIALKRAMWPSWTPMGPYASTIS